MEFQDFNSNSGIATVRISVFSEDMMVRTVCGSTVLLMRISAGSNLKNPEVHVTWRINSNTSNPFQGGDSSRWLNPSSA
jgi:hypothetical protein